MIKSQGKKMIILSSLLFIMIFIQPDSQLLFIENEKRNEELDDFLNNTQSPLIDESPIPQASLNPAQFSQYNVSQFNVSETVTSIAPQTTLDIGSQNLTLEIPQDWTFNNHLMNISAVYKSTNVITDGTINNPSAWVSAASPTYSLSGQYYMVNSTSGGYLSGGVRKNALQVGTPTMYAGSYAIFGQQIIKPDPDLSIQETDFVRRGSIQYPILEEFLIDPLWTKLLNNPFGGQTQTAKTVLQWNSGNIECYIKAGTSSIQLGNPSIAWQRDFTFGLLVPKQVLLSITWSVENLNYEMNDNFMVIVRVDGNFVNGTRDFEGNTFFNNASSMAIEYDGLSEDETVSHGFITRIFDITNIINSNLDTHSLELGIWFSNIDETNDEVRVRFDQVVIRAEEVDQYKIGDFRFDSSVSYTQISDLNDWIVFSNIENAEGLEETSILGNLSQFTAGTYTSNITSRSKEILNSSVVSIFIGVYLARNRAFSKQWDVYFDNIVLNLTYAQKNLSKLELYYTTGGEPKLVPDWIFETTSPTSSTFLNITFGFENGSPYAGAKMRFQSSMTVSRQLNNVAAADYSISGLDNENIEKINWNIKYNNSATINSNWQYFNFNFSRYQFTIIDLPAYDGLGNESIDWKFEKVLNPLGIIHNVNASIRTNGTNYNNLTQNLTVKYTTQEFGIRILNGTWISIFTSPNYLSQVVLQKEQDLLLKAYDSDLSQIVVNQTDLDYPEIQIGNYNLSLYNASGIIHQDFSMFNQTVIGNLTRNWTVLDQGVGIYQLCAVWNDTLESTGQTLRIGIRCFSFEMWRKTTANLLIEPPALNSGNKSIFYFNYSQTLGNIPITNAAPYITLYNNMTENDLIWGYDWPPYISLIESVLENMSAIGHYNLTFKTLGVPPNNYSVYLNISKPYFDHITLDSFINITGNPLNITVYYGATEQLEKWVIDSDNIPYVNDTFTSWIVVKITDENNQTVQGGIISGRFNGSSNVFYGYDVYSYSLNEADKGLYNISLNTMGLNATAPENPEIFNYNLTITVTVTSYSPSSVIISTAVKPLPTLISASDTFNLYEAGSFEIYASYLNYLNPNNPLPLNGGNLAWTMSANSTIFATGNFTFVLSGVYKAIINLETLSYYINPGIYNFSINGTQKNCDYGLWNQYNLTVYSKYTTQIAVTINPTVRIGQTLDIVANLSYINGTPISNENLEIKITYKGTDSFSVIQTTGSNGYATYSQIVPYSYAYTNVTVNVTYAGNSSVDDCTTGIVQDIEGLFTVNLSLIALNEIRVGYNATLRGNITIEEQTTYSNIFLTIAAWYDGQKTSPIFIADVRCDESGFVSYEIPIIQDGHNNITFFMDYSGSSTIDYGQVNFTVEILPKWDIVMQITNLTNNLRIGYDFKLQVNASFLNISCNESLYGLVIIMEIKFASGSITNIESFFDIFGSVVFTYTLPDNVGSWMNVTLKFSGNFRINPLNNSNQYQISPKWGLQLALDALPSEIRIGQTLNFIIHGNFTDSNCIESLLGLPITIRLNFGNGYAPELTGTLSETGVLSIQYQITPQSGSQLELTLSSIGTSRISNSTYNLTTLILGQKTIHLVILSEPTYQDFSGSYSFSVKITDDDLTSLENQKVYFIVKNEQNVIIGNYSAISNIEGIASALIPFEDTGEFRIDVIYVSVGIYQAASLSSNNEFINVRIVDYGILFIDNLPWILLALGIAIASGFVFQRTVIRPKQIRYQNALKEIHRRFADVENMQYLLIIHKDAGVPVFSRAFTEIPIDETLVSGFLSAINSFGAEIGAKVGGMKTPEGKNAGDMGSGLEELAYGMFKIAVFEGEFVRSAVLLLKTASPSLKLLMKQFNTEFEKEYNDVVRKFTGQIPDPEPIMELVERILHADLLYMHNLVMNKVTGYLKQVGSKTLKGMILTEAQTSNFNNTFKVREMINTMAGYGKSDVATFNAIEDMRRAGVVFAVNSRTKFLIEKFRPFIQPLSENAKKFLKFAVEGPYDRNLLRKQLGVKELDSIFAELSPLELVGSDKLTDTGIIIATLLNLMPDL